LHFYRTRTERVRYSGRERTVATWLALFIVGPWCIARAKMSELFQFVTFSSFY